MKHTTTSEIVEEKIFGNEELSKLVTSKHLQTEGIKSDDTAATEIVLREYIITAIATRDQIRELKAHLDPNALLFKTLTEQSAQLVSKHIGSSLEYGC